MSPPLQVSLFAKNIASKPGAGRILSSVTSAICSASILPARSGCECSIGFIESARCQARDVVLRILPGDESAPLLPADLFFLRALGIASALVFLLFLLIGEPGLAAVCLVTCVGALGVAMRAGPLQLEQRGETQQSSVKDADPFSSFTNL
jgi:hypothetical protein